jgi:uncharacterized protein YcbK (DUF882 family)
MATDRGSDQQQHGDDPPTPGKKPSHPMARRAFLASAASLCLTAALAHSAWAAPASERRLSLYNPHTDERFDDVYWSDGDYVVPSLDNINWLMRDFHHDRVAAIDPGLLDLLQRISALLERDGPINVLSGYRTAATNRMLRREGFRAAPHSEHLVGRAADIRVDRVRLKQVRRAALSLKAGGVGTYWHDDFVHVDVGPVRSW